MYTNARAFEEILARDGYCPRRVSYSKLFPSDCVRMGVIFPTQSIENVEMKPSLLRPWYANAKMSEVTYTSELPVDERVS